MAYILERFGTLTLPTRRVRHDHDAVAARGALVQTAAGVFDADGDDPAALNLPQPLNYQGLIYEEDMAAWRAAVDALRGMSRKRARLYRRGLDDDAVHWCVARLMAAATEYDLERFAVYDVRLRFNQLSPWVGHDHTAWTLDDGSLLDDALYLDESGFTATLSAASTNLVVSNGGNRATEAVRVEITAGSANLTALTITGGGAHVVFTGTVAAGQTLVIDSGAQAVQNNGAAAYAGFALGGSHMLESWLRLEPGATTLTIARTGGSTNSTVRVEFRDGWE